MLPVEHDIVPRIWKAEKNAQELEEQNEHGRLPSTQAKH